MPACERRPSLCDIFPTVPVSQGALNPKGLWLERVHLTVSISYTVLAQFIQVGRHAARASTELHFFAQCNFITRILGQQCNDTSPATLLVTATAIANAGMPHWYCSAPMIMKPNVLRISHGSQRLGQRLKLSAETSELLLLRASCRKVTRLSHGRPSLPI